MKITLDRIALKSLIDADPEFEADLKASVIAEVGRRFFEKDAKRVIAAAEPELFAQALAALQTDVDTAKRVQEALHASLTVRDGNWSTRTRISPETKRVVDSWVEEMKQTVIHDARAQISAAYGEAIKAAVDEKLATTDIEEQIAKRVDRLVEREIEDRANDKFRARMAELKGLMG